MKLRRLFSQRSSQSSRSDVAAADLGRSMADLHLQQQGARNASPPPGINPAYVPRNVPAEQPIFLNYREPEDDTTSMRDGAPLDGGISRSARLQPPPASQPGFQPPPGGRYPGDMGFLNASYADSSVGDDTSSNGYYSTPSPNRSSMSSQSTAPSIAPSVLRMSAPTPHSTSRAMSVDSPDHQQSYVSVPPPQMPPPLSSQTTYSYSQYQQPRNRMPVVPESTPETNAQQWIKNNTQGRRLGTGNGPRGSGPVPYRSGQAYIRDTSKTSVVADDVRETIEMLRQFYQMELAIHGRRYTREDAAKKQQKVLRRKADLLREEIENNIRKWQSTKDAQWTSDESQNVLFCSQHVQGLQHLADDERNGSGGGGVY